ncbi:DUF2637 domain-containing protein [Streptacidiphilus jiangxiensis]|uniref:DUF2637 domain-containing protein n=1 Tax=Streptacidiphilus jiangxiensis TaxID=235985 RepID=A0A1H8B3D5_STRJI|nr:DUF2637 domain-containing protein [Streptacidiphilus jiangxiensis]SEM76598.1 Protein of unknown function [Streptacidiphilus jiangxiensis]
MEPTSGGLDHRTEPLEPTAPPDSDTESTARTPHRGEKALLGAIVAGSAAIAGIGFTGSYAAVRHLAVEKGFSWFSYAFPIGVDVGIAVILALDVYLTWKRMAFWPLRMIAWVLTAATVAFNASISWPDPVGTTMHGVIPLLFVIVVEAARHVVRRSAELADDHSMDSIRWWRWVLSPVGTFRLWRRMKLWEIRSYEQIVHLERARVMYRKDLRRAYGWKWRTQAPLEALRPLRLAGYGIGTPTLLQALADNPHWTLERAADPGAEQPTAAVAAAAGPAELGAVQPEAVAPAESAEEQLDDPSTPQDPPAALDEALAAIAEFRALMSQMTPPPAAPQPEQVGVPEPAALSAAAPAVPAQPWWQTAAADGHHTQQPAPAAQQPAFAPAPASLPAPPSPQPAPPEHGYPAVPLPLAAEVAPTIGSTPVEPPAVEEQPAAVAPPEEPVEDPSAQDDSADGRALKKKDRARLVYVEHQQAGRELTRGQLAELAGYAHEGSARTVYNELLSELGPIVVQVADPQLPVELASVGASA